MLANVPDDRPAELPFYPWDWLARHPFAVGLLGVVCLGISLGLIRRMWKVHRAEPFVHKLLWTGFLLVPLFGWVFYAGFFRVPDRHDIPATANYNYLG